MKLILTFTVFVETADERAPDALYHPSPDGVRDHFEDLCWDLSEELANRLGPLDVVVQAEPLGHSICSLAQGCWHDTFKQQRVAERNFLRRPRSKPGCLPT